MGIDTVLAFVSIMGGVGGIVFGLASYSRNHKRDAHTEGARLAALSADIGSVKSGVHDIKRQIERLDEKQEKQYVEMMTRLVAVEASARQAHKRLDRMEERTNE